MWRDQVQGVISAKKSDTCRGFAVQSPQLTKGKARKEKKRNHPWESAAWIRNLAQTVLKTAQITSEEPVLSLNNGDSSITVRINEQRIKMIVDSGSKYDIISSELHKTQFKNYELSQTQKR